MSLEQIRKLLGGYATGTLTPEEQRTLFEAALEDQELFDALAREQSLRDLLRDPAAKAQLLAALDDEPITWRQRAARWMWGHAVGLAAVACFVTVGGYVARQAHFTPPRVVLVATEPTTVEVSGSQPPAEPAPPRRTFDLESAKKAAAPTPEMPPPPVVKQPTVTVHVIGRQFPGNPITAFTGQPPAVPLPESAPAPPPPQFDALAQLRQSGVAGAAMGGGGRGGAAGRGPAEQLPAAAMAPRGPAKDVTVSAVAGPVTTREVAVTAMATPAPVQRMGPENSRLVDSSQLNQQTPGVYFGNAYLTGGSTTDDRTQLEMAAPRPVGAGKLDPALAALLQRVRTGARPSAEEGRFVSGGQVNLRMTLTNPSADSLAQLRSAGLTITRQERNELTGHIAVEKLEAVTQFAFVVWITPR